MNLFLAATIGVLFAAGTYMLLRPNLIRIVLGMGLYSNAVNLLMIACGGYNPKQTAPFVGANTDATDLMDPLPPDIILTAIVISFAVGALFLTLCYRVYLDHGTDNPEELPNHESPGETPDNDDSHSALNNDASSEADGPHVADRSDHSHDNHGNDHDNDGNSDVPNVIAELAKPHPKSPKEIVPEQSKRKTD